MWLDMSAPGMATTDARRQARSARLVTEILDRRPGFVLADEVGMGKTYVTFGVIALHTERAGRFRTLVVAPGRELAAKWHKDLLDFAEKPSIKQRSLPALMRPRVATTTNDLLAARGPGVVITTLSAVVGGLAKSPDWERAWLFEATLHRSRRRAKTRRALARRYGIPAAMLGIGAHTELFGGDFATVQPIARRHLGGFLLEDRAGSREEFDAALRAARREVIRRRLRRFDLLVLDEAHKLKNPSSKRFQYLEQILVGRFDRMLFLTATPFQIDLRELAAVFRLLGHAQGPGQAELQATTSSVIELANRYRDRFDQLERTWRFSPTEAACLAEDSAGLNGPQQMLRSAFLAAVETRDALAADLGQVMLRERRHTGHRRERVGSLRPTETQARSAERGVVVRGAGRLLFAASVRLFHEMRRNGGPTFDPVVLQSLTSSYDAYLESPVHRRATRGREPFLAQLIVEMSQGTSHPKIEEVVDAVAAAAAQGEKTLVFTERRQTAHRLARDIAERLATDARAIEQRSTNGSTRRLDLLIDEFANRRSPLALAWRDNLLHTFLPLTLDGAELRRLTRARELRPVITRALREASLGVSIQTARKRDVYAAAAAVERHVIERATIDDADRAYALELLDYDDTEFTRESGGGAEHALPRFDADDALRLLLRTKGFWARAVDPRVLALLEPALRRRLVLAVRGALTREDSETRHAVLRALARRRADRARALDRAMGSPSWEPIRARAARFVSLVLEHEAYELRSQWIDALEATRGSVARLTGDDLDTDRTQRGRAFNTPFRPHVIVAMPISQEGLDLQRECSRIIHHDLSWNPATLEQRVGRIDRIHSRTERLRAAGEDTRLDIGVPIIRGTIDERMWRIVHSRRSWFDLCLGLEHDWESGTLDDASPPLPASIADRLRIDLSLAAQR
jgi:SNF2-related domain/Helicase conserved C-terminal domain